MLGKAILPAHGRIYLSVTASEEGYDFYYGMDDQELIPVFTGADPAILSSLVNEGFTGAYLGMYASSNKTASDNSADFDWFLYEGQDWSCQVETANTAAFCTGRKSFLSILYRSSGIFIFTVSLPSHLR